MRTLIATHLVVFAAGFVLGKSIDADELELYRDLHESSWTKMKRKAGTVGVGILILGSTFVVVRLASRMSSKSA